MRLLCSDEEVLGRCREIASVFATVERMLQEDNLGTFGHMITHAYHLLQQDSDSVRSRSRFILVDEFQDVNFAQVKVLQRLAGEERNVFAVGDPDQAIYRFRGASSAAFVLFQRHFPGVGLVKLEKNRRSTSPNSQLCVCSDLQKSERLRHGTRLRRLSAFRPDLSPRRGCGPSRQAAAARPGRGGCARPRKMPSARIVTALRDWQRKTRRQWSDCAVLYRTHSHRDQLAAELASQGIPFSIENMDVMDMPEARDLFACLGAVVSDADGASLFRVAALPQFAAGRAQSIRKNCVPESRPLPATPVTSAIALVLSQIEGGPAVLEPLRQTRDEIAAPTPKGRAAVDLMVRNFCPQSRFTRA